MNQANLMRPYLGPPWTNSCQIWCVRVFHHVLLKYCHENAEMQKIKFDDVTLQSSIIDTIKTMETWYRGTPNWEVTLCNPLYSDDEWRLYIQKFRFKKTKTKTKNKNKTRQTKQKQQQKQNKTKNKNKNKTTTKKQKQTNRKTNNKTKSKLTLPYLDLV